MGQSRTGLIISASAALAAAIGAATGLVAGGAHAATLGDLTDMSLLSRHVLVAVNLDLDNGNIGGGDVAVSQNGTVILSGAYTAGIGGHLCIDPSVSSSIAAGRPDICGRSPGWAGAGLNGV